MTQQRRWRAALQAAMLAAVPAWMGGCAGGPGGRGGVTQREWTVGFEPRGGPVADAAPALTEAAIERAAERAGIRLKWKPAPEGAAAALASGKVDLWPALSHAEARPGSVSISASYRTESYFLLTRGEAADPARWQGKLAVALADRDASRRLLPLAEVAAVHGSAEAAFEAACEGKAMAALLPAAITAWPAACGGNGGGWRLAPLDGPATRIGVGASEKSAGARAAAEALAREWRGLERDGTLNALRLARGERPTAAPPVSGASGWNWYETPVLGIHLLTLALLGYAVLRLRRLRREAEAARSQAQLANRAKNDFFATLSHELRTPMNGVLGMAEALAGSPLNAAQSESVSILRRSAESLLALIDDLLDFARLDAGKLRIDTKPFELWTVLEEAALLHEAQARRQGLALRLLTAAEVPQLVVGDSRRLRQVAINLLSNAIKFTPAGSVTVSATVPRWMGPEARVRIAVTDTGIGIDAAKHHLLFQRFSRVDTSSGGGAVGASGQRGTGLGLAIAKELVTAMGGTIGMESARGKGATFWFELPLPAQATAAPATEARPAAGVSVACASPEARLQVQALLSLWGAGTVAVELAPGAGTDALSEPVRPSQLWRRLYGPRDAASAAALVEGGLHGRILLVEDNAVNEKVSAALLRKLGLEVDVAHNGVECLERWSAGRYDAILMDCTMPVMDGLEATKLIRQRETGPHLRTPIIALTASALEQSRQECIAAGMDDFVSKPVRRETLEPLLARWLSRTS